MVLRGALPYVLYLLCVTNTNQKTNVDMKKIITFVCLTTLMSVAGMNMWGQESGRLTFGVISDIHFDNGVGEGAMVKVPKALKNLTSYGKLDALAVVGDLADAGRVDQYELLSSVFADDANFVNPVGDLLFMMGNHDHVNGNGIVNYQEGLKAFNGGEPYPLDQYKVIKGFPFIAISMRNSASNDTSSDANGTGEGLYDLQGRRVERAARRGIYLRNGKKHVVAR